MQAAEHGHAATSARRAFEGLREAWTTYKEVASRVSGRDIPMGQTASGQTLNLLKTIHIADTQEQAEKEAREAVNTSLSFSTGRREGWARKGIVAADEELTNDDLNADWFDFAQKKEFIWVGTADYVFERIDKLRSELNCQHVTLWPNPVVSFEATQRSLEVFAERVMPRFQKQEAAVA